MPISLYFILKGFTFTLPFANSRLALRSFKSSLLKSIKLKAPSNLLNNGPCFGSILVVNNSANALPDTVFRLGENSLSNSALKINGGI